VKKPKCKLCGHEHYFLEAHTWTKPPEPTKKRDETNSKTRLTPKPGVTDEDS
jgi:hypothetical protein